MQRRKKESVNPTALLSSRLEAGNDTLPKKATQRERDRGETGGAIRLPVRTEGRKGGKTSPKQGSPHEKRLKIRFLLKDDKNTRRGQTYCWPHYLPPPLEIDPQRPRERMGRTEKRFILEPENRKGKEKNIVARF